MFRTLLLTVDVNDFAGSKRPAEAAKLLVERDGAELHVMNVVPDFGMAVVGMYFTKDHNAQMLQEANKALTDWAKDRFDGIDVSLSIDQGTVYEQVLKEAGALDADIIVVGAHKSQLQDYLIGPNAARIARHAKQSVFVVRD